MSFWKKNYFGNFIKIDFGPWFSTTIYVGHERFQPFILNYDDLFLKLTLRNGFIDSLFKLQFEFMHLLYVHRSNI